MSHEKFITDFLSALYFMTNADIFARIISAL